MVENNPQEKIFALNQCLSLMTTCTFMRNF